MASLHPQPSDYYSQESLEAYYLRLRADHINNRVGTGVSYHLPPGTNPGPPPPPPDLQPIIDKTAEYVARNSEEFERTVLEKHCGDPKFGFLNPWDKHYPYYKLQLQHNKERVAEQALATIERDLQQAEREATQRGEMIQKLSDSGAVRFKLQPKKMNKVVLDIEVTGLGPDAEEREEGEGEGEGEGENEKEDHAVSNELQYEPSVQDEQIAKQDTSQDTYYHNETGLPAQPALSDQAHYSAEGMMYYCSTASNGEVAGESGEESPAAKRAKTDKNTDVMDNKVQVYHLMFMLQAV